MTPTAVVFMVVFWGAILLVTAWCFWRVFRPDGTRKKE